MRVCQFRHFGKWTTMRGSPKGLPVRKNNSPFYRRFHTCQTGLANNQFAAHASQTIGPSADLREIPPPDVTAEFGQSTYNHRKIAGQSLASETSLWATHKNSL